MPDLNGDKDTHNDTPPKRNRFATAVRAFGKPLARIWRCIRVTFRRRTGLINTVLTLISTVVVVCALYLSIQNAKEAVRFQSSVDSTLTHMSQLSDDLTEGLAQLPGTIEQFDQTVAELSVTVAEQRDSLQSSIGSLSDGVDDFSRSLVSYRDHLDSIVATADRQLVLLKKTQAMWEAEVARKPILVLHVDTLYRLSSDSMLVEISLHNKGDRAGKSVGILVRVPSNLQFLADRWTVAKSIETINKYSYYPIEFVPYHSDEGMEGVFTNRYMRFTLVRQPGDDFPSYLSYTIFEERIGSTNGTLKLDR